MFSVLEPVNYKAERSLVTLATSTWTSLGSVVPVNQVICGCGLGGLGGIQVVWYQHSQAFDAFC